jgi:hypothetical protein
MPDVVLQRTANTSRSVWSRTVASNAGPAKTVVGSGQRPTQTTARRWRYGFARTDISDFSAPRGRHHCRDMWIHRISCCAEEQATRTGVLRSGLLLWVHGGRDPAQKASRSERTRSRRPVRLRASADGLDGSWRWSRRCPRALVCGIRCSTGIVAAAVAAPDQPMAPAGIRAIIRCHASQNGERIDPTCECGDGKLVGPSAPLSLCLEHIAPCARINVASARIDGYRRADGSSSY